MAKVIAFTAPKGGSGATLCLAGVWSSFVDKSVEVLACDMCFERCGLDLALGFNNDYVYTLSDAVSGDCSFEETLCKKGSGSFIRCDYEKDFFDVSAAFEILKNSDFKYIFCDLTDRDEDFVKEVLKFTDTLVLVTEPGKLSVQLCERSAGVYDFTDTRVIVNKIIPTYIQKGIHLTIDEILDSIGYPLLGLVPWTYEAEIIYRQGIINSMEDKSLKEAFANIASRIEGQRVCAQEFKKVYDCFKPGRKFSLKAD